MAQESLSDVSRKAVSRKCPECGSTKISLNEEDEYYCEKCGLVIEE